MMRLGVISLGCPKNTVDTECMLSCLDDYILTPKPADADVIIVNTCAFLKAARAESADAINEMLSYREKNRKLKVIVAGCFVSKDIDALRKRFKGVHAWVGINDISNIKRAVDEGGVFDKSQPFVYKGKNHTALLNPYSAYVKVSEGCNHRCAFCTIPSIKGGYRSREIRDVAGEIGGLVGAGIKEINLISQDLIYYGVDIYGKQKIDTLIKNALKSTKKYFWLRLLYLYPDLEMIKKIAALMTADKRLCRYIDIPFQHVSDRMLKSMRRGYRKKDIIDIIKYLRGHVPGISIRSAFIAGFPGETKQDFEELHDFIRQGLIDKAGFFVYSDEPGTRAYTLPGKITAAAAEKRRQILMLDSSEIYHYNNERKKGEIQETLIVGGKGKGIYVGRTRENAPDIDSYIEVKSRKVLETGKFYKVLITGTRNYDLKGEVNWR